jgi:hypothetical protein
MMLNEDEANAVMETLDRLSLKLPPSQERVLLKHLYDLHRLRDQEVWSEMFASVECGDPAERLLWDFVEDDV